MANTAPGALEIIKKNLETTRPTFEEMNLNKLAFAKELEFAIQIFEKNDYLAKTNAQSVKNCLVNIAMSGLTLNPVMKFAYLVPRKGVCCIDPSYQGLIKILTDTGSVQSIKARVVYKKEPFEIELGSGGYVKHTIYKGDDDKGKKIGAYSIAVLNDGVTEHIDFMYWNEIMAIKARSEGVKAGKGSPWDTDEDEMAKKTVVKRHWKYLPKSERALMAANAIDLDNQVNGIDFEKEKKPKDNTNATPNAPIDLALATDEDLSILLEWFDNPELPEIIFGKIKKSAMRSKIEQKYSLGQLEKDKAEEYIKGLQQEVEKAKAGKEGAKV